MTITNTLAQRCGCTRALRIVQGYSTGVYGDRKGRVGQRNTLARPSAPALAMYAFLWWNATS